MRNLPYFCPPMQHNKTHASKSLSKHNALIETEGRSIFVTTAVLAVCNRIALSSSNGVTRGAYILEGLGAAPSRICFLKSLLKTPSITVAQCVEPGCGGGGVSGLRQNYAAGPKDKVERLLGRGGGGREGEAEGGGYEVDGNIEHKY